MTIWWAVSGSISESGMRSLGTSSIPARVKRGTTVWSSPARLVVCTAMASSGRSRSPGWRHVRCHDATRSAATHHPRGMSPHRGVVELAHVHGDRVVPVVGEAAAAPGRFERLHLPGVVAGPGPQPVVAGCGLPVDPEGPPRVRAGARPELGLPPGGAVVRAHLHPDHLAAPGPGPAGQPHVTG